MIPPRKWLFLDFDEVISTFRYSVSIHEHGGVRTSWDPTALNLIERAIEEHDVYLVISSSWRHTIADWNCGYFYRRFRQNGFQVLAKAINRTWELSESLGIDKEHAGRFGIWSTGPVLGRREEEIDNFIRTNCSADDVVCVLDDMHLELQSTTGFVHVTTPYDGMSVHNYVAMRDLFNNGVPNVNLQPKQE